MKLFISTALGLEPLLQSELQQLGFVQVQPTRAGCHIEAELRQAYEVCLWSRIASRVLLPVTSVAAENADDLYKVVRGIDWQHYLRDGTDLAIDFSGTNAHIRHTGFGALKVKDALADWCRNEGWSVPRLTGDSRVRLSVRLHKGSIQIALDFAGGPLHRRGYRARAGSAPLRESLAAALLQYAGWPLTKEQGTTLVDPMCGSGTLLIEAAWMAIDKAPGSMRENWGFCHWPNHDPALWQQVLEEAGIREQRGRDAWQGQLLGSDIDGFLVSLAQDNAEVAGVGSMITVRKNSIAKLQRPAESGLLITNPPYGERLQDQAQALALYAELGSVMRDQFSGWRAAVLSSEEAQAKALGIHSHRSLSFYNGNLACKIYLFDIEPDRFLRSPDQAKPSDGALMVANRLRKNTARLKSWRAQQQIKAWRCYDMDLPEYAAAVDIYETNSGSYALVQEYAPPKSVDPAVARHRLNELVTGVGLAFDMDVKHIELRQRQRQKGTQQYEKQSNSKTPEMQLEEHGGRYLINLVDYLDTGVFLDHRPVRRYIRDHAKGCRFLNLFCYTATATVQAGLGGATSSLSLDMSNTYLRWARRNLDLNGLNRHHHELVRVDCMEWLLEEKNPKAEFDMIFLDPPSFSNSKRMEGVLDIERDHGELIAKSMLRLNSGGQLIFSTNKRGFKLDDAVHKDFAVQDFPKGGIDPDFERRPNIHRCWIVRHV